MIKHLTGNIFEVLNNSIILSVQGVGYEIFVPSHNLFNYKANFPASFWTHHSIKEKSNELYGFENKHDLDFFELLLTVSSIGPKKALVILDQSPSSTIIEGIASEDSDRLSKTAGIGKKMSEKIILALKDKISDYAEKDTGPKESSAVDAMDALVSLGFSEKEARDKINNLDGSLPVETLVKQALQK